MIEDIFGGVKVSDEDQVQAKHPHPHDATAVVPLPKVPHVVDWVLLAFFGHEFVKMAHNWEADTRRGESEELPVDDEVVEHEDNKKSGQHYQEHDGELLHRAQQPTTVTGS